MRPISVLGTLAAMAMSGSVHAATFTALPSNTNLNDLIASEYFVGEGRIGDLGGNATFEMDVGPTTAAPADTANFPWVNGTAAVFDFDWDGATASLTFDGTTVSYQPGPGSFDAIIVRAFAQRDGSSVNLSSFQADGMPYAPGVFAEGPNGTALLQITDIGTPFSITGGATLVWDNQDVPRNSQLAFQFKVVTLVPAPGSAVVLGLIGLTACRRRR